MKRESRIVALCGLSTALSLVMMGLGSALLVMTYAAPILAGVLILVIRQELGSKWALTVWAAVSLLGLMLVPEMEMIALYAGVFGWYPAVLPALNRLHRGVRALAKALLFNGTATAVYGLLMKVMGLQDMPESHLDWILLLVMGNVVFFCYDRMLVRLGSRRLPWLKRLMGG